MSKLFSTTAVPALAGRIKYPNLRRFAQEEDGAVTIFAIAMIMIMALIAGISFDLQRNEMRRVQIQNTADRAVLAAADLGQTQDPKDVVKDYFAKAGIPEAINKITVATNNVEEDGFLNFRSVTVDSIGSMPTNFMPLLGIDELPLRSIATAEESVTSVEVSMVLDISGSMRSNNKIGNLRTAAKDFVDLVVNTATQDRVSISLIPYATTVTAGRDVFDAMAINRNNPYGTCVDFLDSEYDTTAIDPDEAHEQTQFFYWGVSSSNSKTYPNCNDDPRTEILAFSQNATELKDKIDNLPANGNTAIYLGMKWAAGLLDPAFQPANERLASSGAIDTVFSSRPAPMDDVDTLKTVILMTDGVNTATKQIPPEMYANISQAEHWKNNNLDWWLRQNVSYNEAYGTPYQKYWTSKGNTLLNSICTAAKDNGIIIWSIGFEVSDYSASIMQNCASSPSHFFRVDGLEIADAFKSIARQINQLRLTQ
ncbi:Flp pilus assembly protein TadG [Sulfitobacter undariae]|uniref:Flp pilus assembly protein TadG n=1 Tax=Sulfitobacter undariae TaxID=1563671 RepID=A0A7W6E1F8_9RHOB|nr:TadE/TadG family type IV pilus assembly protein [Sulfitobacter undariae]MBB3992961.1 Flp pilus assembly protein TadG [Sulfitobacter undariae]